MQPPTDTQNYLTASELAAATNSSVTTIWRLKQAGKIRFYQPGGKGHLVKFPPDAFEQRSDTQICAGDDAEQQNPEHVHDVLAMESQRRNGDLSSTNSKGMRPRLSGPTPKWMR